MIMTIQTARIVTIAAILTAGQTGCRSPQPCCDTGLVHRELACRTGVESPRVAPCREVVPAGVVFEDGLSEDEAVQTALANNSLFQAAVAQLGMAAGDAKQASLIANPQVLIYFPTSTKEGQYALFQPIESYLLRPLRVKIANREYRRIGMQLVQNGLDVARDVRLAYVELALAADQADLARETLAIRRSIEEITDKRYDDGDISELETISARVDQFNARADAGVQDQSVAIAEAKLLTLIGLPHYPDPVALLPLELPSLPILLEEELIAQALVCRPDFQAAQWSVAAAAQRTELARRQFWRVDGVVDSRSDPGNRTGGGLRFELPVFNRNQGGAIRADWELNAALHSRDAIRDQILADVRTAARQLRQASDALQILQREVEPALGEALRISRQGFADGGTDYLLVLRTTTQYLDARARILVQKAALLRALAQLDRAVGANIEAGPMNVEQLEQVASVPLPSDVGADGESVAAEEARADVSSHDK
ncbi:MAG: TolC family protein [Planctomycetales bacterium]|nr:TolC family protein [Planctomycetales bacterium]